MNPTFPNEPPPSCRPPTFLFNGRDTMCMSYNVIHVTRDYSRSRVTMRIKRWPSTYLPPELLKICNHPDDAGQSVDTMSAPFFVYKHMHSKWYWNLYVKIILILCSIYHRYYAMLIQDSNFAYDTLPYIDQMLILLKHSKDDCFILKCRVLLTDAEHRI